MSKAQEDEVEEEEESLEDPKLSQSAQLETNTEDSDQKSSQGENETLGGKLIFTLFFRCIHSVLV